MSIVIAIKDILWGPPLIILILIAGMVFTFGTKFFQVRFFGHILKNTIGVIFKKNKSEAAGKGLLKPLETISIAIGGAVGVGNIGGVATAIAVGGPGAVFWIWITAFMGMMLKMVEVSLAVHYRSKDEVGGYYGGPTYYMEKALGKERKFKAWSFFAVIFGLGIFSSFIFTMQNYTVSEAVSSTFGVPILVVSGLYLILTYMATAGGIPTLGKIAVRVVPFMCAFYILGGLFIILLNIAHLPSTIVLIIKSAFTGSAAAGGFAGAAVAQVIQVGFSRAVFSNEAGWGTSPMIHASAKTEHPIKQGLWGSFEVFVDTMLVCTITALVIVITGAWTSGLDGATLTLFAFKSTLGSAGGVIITVGVFLFGLSTTTGWWAYFEVLLRHLCKENVKLKSTLIKIFKVIYPIPGFGIVCLSVVGQMPSSEVWVFGDLASGVPTFVNLFVILFLSKKFFELLKDYKARYLGIGKVDPDFKIFYEDEEVK